MANNGLSSSLPSPVYNGFVKDEQLRKFNSIFCGALLEISEKIKMETLDGITIANGDESYVLALSALDRGFETKERLSRSNGVGVGVAMSPAVIRDGLVKTHMLFNFEHISAMVLVDFEHIDFQRALYTVAHECAHVEINSKLDKVFPNVLLQTQYPDVRMGNRWGIILACWEEYAACWIGAIFGVPPTNDYEAMFVEKLKDVENNVNKYIDAYKNNKDVSELLWGVYSEYGDLMKFASYHLGSLEGCGLGWEDQIKTVKALKNHWFKPYFLELKEILEKLASKYGKWTDKSDFELLGDLADKLLKHGVLFLKKIG